MADAPLCNLGAEQAVLGCLLLDNGIYHGLTHIRGEHFFEPLHGRVWDAAHGLIEAGKIASPINVRTALRGDPALIDLDTPSGDYLFAIVERAPPTDSAYDLAAVILDEWTRRIVVEFSNTLSTAAKEANPRPAIDLVSYARRSIENIEAEVSFSDKEFTVAKVAAVDAVAKMREVLQTGKKIGKLCGLRCIDRRMGGLQGGELIIVGGRPSMGKTAFVRAVAHGCAVHNPDEEVLFFAIEMPTDSMMQRELSAITYDLGNGVKYSDMATGLIDEYELNQIDRASQMVPKNLVFKDDSMVGIEDIRRAVWSRKRKGPLALVVIDYLQIMRLPDGKGRNKSDILGEVTASLKRLARQAACAIIVLSQLSRQVESREDKRPQLSDLRESGSIEQDADFVLFPFREVYYLDREKPKDAGKVDHDVKVENLRHVMEVITAKARRTAIGSDNQRFLAEYDHLSNID